MASAPPTVAPIIPPAIGARADINARPTVANLQILRFVAATMVMFGHVEHALQQSVLSNGQRFIRLDPIFWAGGVDVFFVISGFIMYHISWRKFGSANASRRFLIKRIVRIAPPYWFFTALLLGVMAIKPQFLAHGSTSAWHIIASFLFIPANNPSGWFFPVLINGWTLNYEMLFYFVFSTGMRMPFSRGMAFIIAVLLVLSLGVLMRFEWVPLMFWCNPILIEFVFGMGLAWLYQGGLRIRLYQAGLLVVAAVALMLWTTAIGVAGNYYPLRFLWMGVPAALLCAATVFLPEPGKKGSVFRGLVLAGDASYALYLSHPFSLGAAAVLIRAADIHNPWLYIFFALVTSVLVSIVIYQALERPLHAVLDKWAIARLATGSPR